MFKKICLITNYNLYESKRRFTEKLADAMERKGIKTKIIDVKENKLGLETIAQIKQFKPDLTASFNTLLPISDKQFLWDIIKIPHWAILVDPSLYSVSLINSPYSIISCVDRFDCDGLLSTGFKKVFFWPHGVEKDIVCDLDGARPYDVVFLGSCFDYESMRKYWKKHITSKQSQILDNAIDMVLADNRTSLQAALIKAWNEANLFADNTVDFATLFYFLDIYTRGKDRVDLIRSIKDAKVHVFGQLQESNEIETLGWEHYLGKQKNVVLHKPVNFAESLEILKQSKICLNSNPFFKNGSHERVFNSLACGALPITTDNLYVRSQFNEGEDMLFYLNSNLDLVNDQVNELLNSESKRKTMAASGRAKVMKNHTWDKRVEELRQSFPL
jgi:spore maturation protein CgeB